MPSQNELLEIAKIDTALESYLTGIGKISYRFPAHDSGCQSWRHRAIQLSIFDASREKPQCAFL